MHTKSEKPTVNSGSMADIASLLLIFFLVTTTIRQDKGLLLKLPPPPEEKTNLEIHDRNLYKILINANDQYLIEGEVRLDSNGVNEELKAFILNHGKDPELSDNPQKASFLSKQAEARSIVSSLLRWIRSKKPTMKFIPNVLV